MDLVTGAALMLAAQRDTMIATMGFLDLPADMRLVLKASMDAAEQLMHSLDHGVTDNLNEGELSNYLAFFDRMLDCLEREHQIRGELPCRSCGLIGCESCV